MDHNHIEKLLDRYLNGTASAKEKELVDQWLQDHSHTNSKWDQMDTQSKEQWISARFDDINSTIRSNPKVHRLPVTRNPNWRIITTAAAAIVLAFILNWQWPSISNNWKKQELTAQITHTGQKKLVVLPDGSRVWLNSNSELRYPQVFNEKTREVYLSGEAYFDVEHNVKKTFIIHNGSFTTKVLGTAFNIKEDKRKHTVQVTVSRGKVSVANAGTTLAFLTPNQQLSYNLPKQQVTQTTVDAERVIAWRQADLHFDDISFGDAVVQLAVHFGVKISFANEELKNCRFTGTNLADQKLEEILKVMCAFNNATYLKNNDGSIVISGAGCN